jgi:hypothetical protein
MSADATGSASESAATPGESPGQPTEEELRAAYEAELSRITSTDMIAQAVVSLLNIGARRLGAVGGPEAGEAEGAAAIGGRDLEQVRDAIDAVKALLDVLERRIPPQELRSLREALSQLQMAYAREVRAADDASRAAAGGEPGGPQPPTGSEEPPSGGESEGGAGPAESSGRLWVPGR